MGHAEITAGTTGAFTKRGAATYLLSNNHVLANEDLAKAGDRILRRASYDRGKKPSERVARLRFWIKLRKTGINVADAAIAEIDAGVRVDVSRLRGLVNGQDRKLVGLGPKFVDETIGNISGVSRVNGRGLISRRQFASPSDSADWYPITR